MKQLTDREAFQRLLAGEPVFYKKAGEIQKVELRYDTLMTADTCSVIPDYFYAPDSKPDWTDEPPTLAALTVPREGLSFEEAWQAFKDGRPVHVGGLIDYTYQHSPSYSEIPYGVPALLAFHVAACHGWPIHAEGKP